MKHFILALLLTMTAQAVTIHDIQYTTNAGGGTYPSPLVGQSVTFTGVVTATGYYDTRYFVEDVAGGAWSGVLVWDSSTQPDVGDLLQITGEVYEYSGHTEISPVTQVQVLATGQALPAAVEISTGDLDEGEAWEGVLVRFNNVSVTQAPNSYNEWYVSDGSGACQVDDAILALEESGLDPATGDSFSMLRGIVDYQYSVHALNPRTTLDWTLAGAALSLTAHDLEWEVGTSDVCQLQTRELDPSDAVDSYTLEFTLPAGLVGTPVLSSTGTLSAGGSLSLQSTGSNSWRITASFGAALTGSDPLIGIELSGLEIGTGTFDLTAATLGDTSVSQLVDGALSVTAAPPAIGDTLTLIMKPLLNIPQICTPGESFTCLADAATSATGWNAAILREGLRQELSVESAVYQFGVGWWELALRLDSPQWYGLADLELSVTGEPTDTTWHAVQILPDLPDEFYIAQVTDTHLPTSMYYTEEGALQDSSSVEDLRAVFEDLAIINPAFLLHTGDLIHEGELEDFLQARYYTRAQRLLAECEVPVYLVAGNHDLGGWDETPPEDGTSRRDWWRFFGWKHLDNPPAQEPWYTQNYSFDYGPLHLTGMEAYDNYDEWRYSIYGATSFTSGQLNWLDQDLQAADPALTKVLFYHYDFADQLNLASLGVQLALWGHIHSNSGSIGSAPYDLATACCTNGNKAFRLIRVTQSGIQPLATSYATTSQLRLTVSPANDGSCDSVRVSVSNNYDLDFPEAMIRLRLQPGLSTVETSTGSIQQILQVDGATLVELSLPLTAGAGRNATVVGHALALEAPDLCITALSGVVQLQWAEVSGAEAYRVEAAPSMLGPWSDVTQQGVFVGATWYGAMSAGCECFRVIATAP